MDYRPIDPASLKRCSIGMIDSITDVISSARYVESKYLPKKGSFLMKEDDELFLNLDGFDLKSWSGKGLKLALVCKPEIKLPRFPQASWRDAGTRPAGSIKVIAWKFSQVALVIATDPNFIGDQWLGFVPLQSVIDFVSSINKAAA